MAVPFSELSSTGKYFTHDFYQFYSQEGKSISSGVKTISSEIKTVSSEIKPIA